MRTAPTTEPTADRAVYERAIQAIAPMDAEALEVGWACVRVRRLGRGEHLLKAGQIASEVAVVAEGLVREFFIMADGVERTKAFVTRGQLTGSLADLLMATPSKAFIVAEEPSRLLVTQYAAMQALAARHDAWRAFGARATERRPLPAACPAAFGRA